MLTGPPTDRAHLHRLGDAERRRLGPDALAWSVVYPDAGDGFELLARRGRHRVLVVGRGRLADARPSRALRRTGIVVRRRPRSPPPRAAGPADVRRSSLLVGEDAVSTDAGAALLGRARRRTWPSSPGADRAVVGPLVRARALGLPALPRAAPHRPRPGLAGRRGPARPAAAPRRGARPR